MTSADLRTIADEIEALRPLAGHLGIEQELERIAARLRTLADRIDAGDFKHERTRP